MHRREFVAGATALALTGAGAAVTIGDWDPFGLDGSAIEPVELETIDAPGSEAGTIAVPESGRVTLLELFATWCDVCERSMEPMGEVYDDVGSNDDVQFVSVTNEPLGRTITAADVADWWDTHGGRWTVAHDAALDLTTALDASGVPYTFVFDESNRLTWSGRGYKAATELRNPILAALGE